MTMTTPDVPKLYCPRCGSRRFTSHKEGYDANAGSILGIAGYACFGPLGGLLGLMFGLPGGDVFFVCSDCGCRFKPRQSGS